MYRSSNMNLYLRAFSIALYQMLDLHYLPIQTFFWSANCTILVCKFFLLFQTILDLWPVLISEIFRCWDLKKAQFNSQLLFQLFFLVCKLYKSGLSIITFLHMGNIRVYYLFKGFQYLAFQFLEFLSILSLVFLAIFPVLEMLKFWSVNHICQVCKLLFCFGHVGHFGQYYI